LKNAELDGREYALVSAGSAGGIGVGKFSIYDMTAGLSRLIIDPNGNVGIGTASPTQKLDVVGNVKGTGLCIGNDCRIAWPSGADTDWIISGTNMYSGVSGNVGVGTITPGSKLHVVQNANTLRLQGTDHTYIEFYPDGAATRKGYLGFPSAAEDNIRIKNEISGGHLILETNGGNVGIGTTSPTQKLDVVGDVIVQKNNEVFLNLKNTELNGREYALVSAGSAGGIGVGKFSIYDVTAGLSRLIIDPNGNVGIGMAGPTQKLHVAGRGIFTGAIAVGTPTTQTWNAFGDLTSKDDAAVADQDDVFISDDLEVNGQFFLTGGSTVIVNSDIAEVLLTKKGRDSVLCEADPNCIVEDYEAELDLGDLVCINSEIGRTIMRCTEANSQLVVGFVSNTSVMNMGNNLEYGYPIAVAGVVFAKVTTVNGNINPGDLLVSADKDGYAMKNNNPRDGTVVGKAFDFCYEEECKILTFVALS